MCWVSFFECEQLCLFTVLDFSEGYCSPLCSIEHADCPDGYICTYVDEHEISVCFVDPEYVPPEPELEPGPEPTEDIIAEVAAPDQPDEIIGEEDLPIAETAPSDNGGPGDSVLEDVATSGGTKKSTSGCTASRTASASTETWLLFLAVAGCLWIRFRTDAQIHHGHR
jgi:hypothetical protein